MPATPTAWFVRPALWFVAASTATTIVHELAHAVAASALGVRCTLYSYFVDLDPTLGPAANLQGAVIGLAGPLVCLLLGAAACIAFRRARKMDVGLQLLYFAIFGIGTFAGNSMSIAFVGDFAAVATALGLPMSVRYALATIGGLSTAAIHFWGGRQLVRMAPPDSGRVRSMIGVVALPAVLGTAFVIVVNQPMPSAFAAARIAEASFWLFAAAGALTTRRHSDSPRYDLRVRPVDVLAVVLAVLVVRLLVPGVPFAP